LFARIKEKIAHLFRYRPLFSALVVPRLLKNLGAITSSAPSRSPCSERIKSSSSSSSPPPRRKKARRSETLVSSIEKEISIWGAKVGRTVCQRNEVVG